MFYHNCWSPILHISNEHCCSRVTCFLMSFLFNPIQPPSSPSHNISTSSTVKDINMLFNVVLEALTACVTVCLSWLILHRDRQAFYWLSMAALRSFHITEKTFLPTQLYFPFSSSSFFSTQTSVHFFFFFLSLSPKILTIRLFKLASTTWENLGNWQMWLWPTTSSINMPLLPWALCPLLCACCIQLFSLYL